MHACEESKAPSLGFMAPDSSFSVRRDTEHIKASRGREASPDYERVAAGSGYQQCEHVAF
jgi:hypothetical protein